MNSNSAVIKFVDDNWVGFYNGKKVVKSYDQTRVVKMMAKAGHPHAPIEGIDVATGAAVEEYNDESFSWPINQRFDFVTQLVTMVARQQAVSVVVTGSGGLGKSHTVRAALTAAGLREADALQGIAPSSETFTVIKGYSTAKGLYRTLYDLNDSTIVFDDCDEVMKDAVALNVLKGALDSYDKRVISWNAETRGDDDLPRSFQFTGRVVFISNMARNRINNALLTRAYTVDLHMTQEQRIERMEVLIDNPEFMPGFSDAHKQDAMDLIRSVADRANEISLRTLQAVTRIRANAGPGWKQLAEYSLTN